MDDPSSEPRYRIGTVARMTGVSTHALRKWQGRYRAVVPARSEAGSRLYSDADVARLRLIKELVDRGHSVSDVATLSMQELGAIATKHRQGPTVVDVSPEASLLVERYLSAVASLDVDAAERLLSRASLGLEPRTFIMEVLVPLLTRVGERWYTGELCIAHEHASSAIVRNHLGGLLRLSPRTTGTRTAISTTPQSELHEFGALLSALMLSLSGWRVLYLGPNLPAMEIAQAARMSSAAAVLLSVVTDPTPQLERELGEVQRLVPRHVPIVIGGRAVDQLPTLDDRFQRMHSLVEIEDWAR